MKIKLENQRIEELEWKKKEKPYFLQLNLLQDECNEHYTIPYIAKYHNFSNTFLTTTAILTNLFIRIMPCVIFVISVITTHLLNGWSSLFIGLIREGLQRKGKYGLRFSTSISSRCFFMFSVRTQHECMLLFDFWDSFGCPYFWGVECVFEIWIFLSSFLSNFLCDILWPIFAHFVNEFYANSRPKELKEKLFTSFQSCIWKLFQS